MKGTILIISAPSRGGKDKVVAEILKDNRWNLVLLPGYTTRPPRDYEVPGKHYFFVSPAEFQKMTKVGDFVERAKVGGYWFGTSNKALKKLLAADKNVILKIEVKGAKQVMKKFPGQTLAIFLKPGSLADLRKRFTGDHNFTPDQIRRRLDKARREINASKTYNYVVSNLDGKLNETINEVKKILNKKCD